MRRTIVPILLVFGLAALLAVVPAFDAVAQDKKSGGQDKKKAQANKADDAPAVFTTEDLERMFGNEDAIPESSVTAEGAIPAVIEPPKPAGQEGAEAKPAGEGEGEAAAAETPAVDAATRASAIRIEIANLNKRLLSLRNPLLRGATPPTDEEREQAAGMNNIEQIRLVEDKIADLRAELSSLIGGE